MLCADYSPVRGPKSVQTRIFLTAAAYGRRRVVPQWPISAIADCPPRSGFAATSGETAHPATAVPLLAGQVTAALWRTLIMACQGKLTLTTGMGGTPRLDEPAKYATTEPRTPGG